MREAEEVRERVEALQGKGTDRRAHLIAMGLAETRR